MPDGITKMISRSRHRALADVLAALGWTRSIGADSERPSSEAMTNGRAGQDAPFA
jgi:hypothetical protein